MSFVARFFCLGSLFVIARVGRRLYNDVKGLDNTGIYDVIPNGRLFLNGLEMYTTWVSKQADFTAKGSLSLPDLGHLRRRMKFCHACWMLWVHVLPSYAPWPHRFPGRCFAFSHRC